MNIYPQQIYQPTIAELSRANIMKLNEKQGMFMSNWSSHGVEYLILRIPKETILVFRVRCETLNSNQSK